jgi:hypothetical protein
MNTFENPVAAEQSQTIPDLSLVVPCYNEEGCLEFTVPPLVQ